MRGTCAHPNDVTETKPRPPQGAAESVDSGFPHVLHVRLAPSTVAYATAACRRCQRITLPYSRGTPLACSICRSLLRGALSDPSDPPAPTSREPRFEVLGRVPLVVAISDFSSQESKESCSHHLKGVTGHRQLGPHCTNATPYPQSTPLCTLVPQP